MDETIRVALRIRPLSNTEQARGCQSCVDCIPNEPQVVVRNTDKAFTFNYVFGPESSQCSVYDTAVKSLVQQLFKGYNVTILAYGQTGSGKTYSMGTCYDGQGEMGIIPRAISDIFEVIASHEGEKDFRVTTSFIELYKEQLYDLLACSSKPRDQCVVDIREDTKGICIPGLTEVEVSNADETNKSLIRGSSGRATGATAMNAQSSRSHAIFTITINMSPKNSRSADTISKFHLVDLAGSERSKKTQATGDRFKEGININKGLLALGNVISALGDGQQRGYVSYRDSKLTRLLQDSLGGNSMTLMIACASPADYNCEETLSTLRYADRARHIRNKPVVNQDPKAAEVQRLQQEVNNLRLQLGGSGGTTSACPKEHASLQENNIILLDKNKKLTEALSLALTNATNLYEKAHLAEVAREKMNVKLAELSAFCESALQTSDNSNKMQQLKDLQAQINNLQVEQKNEEQDILNHNSFIGLSSSAFGKDDEDGSSDCQENMSSETLEELAQKEETHTLQQAGLNQELQNLMRALALKEKLASQMIANSNSMVNPDHEENVRLLEDQIGKLEQERDELMQQLKTVQEKNVSGKIAEQRRKQLQELESKMSELQKKITEQNKVIKMKEKSEQKVATLNNEIRDMKNAKIKLIRQMRQENEQFRAWKLMREKELNQLRAQDRKRQNQLTRMELIHSKQQNVLKRKVEEASAANKRLKEALLLQKQAQDKRHNPQGKMDRVQTYVARELEVLVSTLEAEQVRDKLVEHRAALCEEIHMLKTKVANAQEEEKAVIELEINQLNQDLNLRSAQIADLNQKILDSDQENKTRTRWDTIQSMVEAKYALKYLFDLVADIKRDAGRKENSLDELEEQHRKDVAQIKLLEERFCELEQKHKEQLLLLEREYEEKISVLLRNRRKPGSTASESNDDMLDRCEIMNEHENELAMLREEIKQLKEKKINLKNPQKKKSEVKSKLKQLQTTYVASPDMFLDYDSEDHDDEDDEEGDPDWQKTPLFKRLQKARRKTQYPASDATFISVKRSIDGETHCSCRRGTCKGCACRKSQNNCTDSCKCDPQKCGNRMDKTPDSGNSPELSVNIAKRPRTDETSVLSDMSNTDVSCGLFKPSGKFFATADVE